MSNIITLMNELDLSDEVITQTVSKITGICARNDYPVSFLTSGYQIMAGNGNGNGNN